MTPTRALAFVRRHGIVLESACRDGIPSLADAIAGAPLHGRWWAHPKGKAIFAATRAVRESPEILVCRLVDAKITFVHERLWPALARNAERFAAGQLDRVHEIHASDGKHHIQTEAFPDWMPEATLAAGRLAKDHALAALGPIEAWMRAS